MATGRVTAYDNFSRLIATVKPGGATPDTLEIPTLAYVYRLLEPVPTANGTGVVNWIETRAHEEYGDQNAYFVSRTFMDGLGRTILTKEEDETAGRSVVRDAVTFNERLKPYQELTPFYGQEGLAFEDITHPDWTGSWVIDGEERVYGLVDAPSTETLYDATSRDSVSILPDGSYSRTTYLPLVMRMEDENDTDPSSKYFGTPTIQYSDGLGRVIGLDKVVKLNDDGTPRGTPAIWRTIYTYDLLDNLIGILDSQNNRRIRKYDAIKRLNYADDPDRGSLWYSYDDASNLVERFDAKNQRVTQTLRWCQSVIDGRLPRYRRTFLF